MWQSTPPMMVVTVLYQVILATVVSLVIGTVIGGAIGAIIGAIASRREETVIPAILGSSLGVLITAILPLVSQPSLTSGGGYAAIALRFFLFILIPLGSIVGGVIGSIFGLIFVRRLSPRLGWISLVAIYLLLVTGFYLKDVRYSPPIAQEKLPVVRTIPGYDDTWFFCCMTFSADGEQLAIAHSGNVQIVGVNSGKLLHNFEGLPRVKMKMQEDDIKAIALAGDGKTLAIAAELKIKIIDVATGKLLHKLDGGQDVQFTADGRTLVGLTGKDDSNSGTSIQAWDVKSGKILRKIPLERGGLHIRSIFAITPDSKTLVVAPAYNNRIELWDLATGKRIQTWAGKENQEIETLTLTPDGKTAIISQGYTLQLLDLSSGKITKTMKSDANALTLQVDASGDKLLEYNSYYLSLWQLKTGKRLQKWTSANGVSLKPVALSPDGMTLAIYGRNTKDNSNQLRSQLQLLRLPPS